MFITAVKGFSPAVYRSKPNKTNHADTYLSYQPPQLKNDVFVKTNTISFKGKTELDEAEAFVEKIKKNQVKPLSSGWQCEFYKINDNMGIKAPKPLHPEFHNADFKGLGNVKEHRILRMINEINPDIAVRPVSLVFNENKNYLAEEFVNGVHPIKSHFTKEHLKDIFEKCFELDINGIVNNDLQNGNIFLLDDKKTKLIDFGSYSVLQNNGSYLNSDYFNEQEIFSNDFLKTRMKSPLENRFMANYYLKENIVEPIMYLENPHLKIKSNAQVFEYRTLYDYLMNGREENPKDFFRAYLQSKAENYHGKMVEFLEKLPVSKDTPKEYEMHQNAIKHEKMLKEVFSNPSDDVIRTEMGKIQLKWHINNDYQYRIKALDCFQKLSDSVCDFIQNAKDAEKSYFEAFTLKLNQYNHIMAQDTFKGGVLYDEENVMKTMFKKAAKKVEQVVETTVTNTGKSAEKAVKSNKKALGVLGALAVFGSAGAYLYNKKESPKPIPPAQVLRKAV